MAQPAKTRPSRIMAAALIAGGALGGGGLTRLYDVATTPNTSFAERADMNAINIDADIIREALPKVQSVAAILPAYQNVLDHATMYPAKVADANMANTNPERAKAMIGRQIGEIARDTKRFTMTQTEQGQSKDQLDGLAKAVRSLTSVVGAQVPPVPSKLKM